MFYVSLSASESSFRCGIKSTTNDGIPNELNCGKRWKWEYFVDGYLWEGSKALSRNRLNFWHSEKLHISGRPWIILNWWESWAFKWTTQCSTDITVCRKSFTARYKLLEIANSSSVKRSKLRKNQSDSCSEHHYTRGTMWFQLKTDFPMSRVQFYIVFGNVVLDFKTAILLIVSTRKFRELVRRIVLLISH